MNCLNIAHRGYTAEYPEDTMLAFRMAAASDGCEGISIDVQLSKDGVPVIIHDTTVDRTAVEGTGEIRQMTLAELQKIDVSGPFAGKYGPQAIPTLREYLEFAKPLDLINIIELKTENFEYPGIEEKVVELVREFGMEEQVIFASCNHFSIKRLQALAPEMKTGLLCHSWILDAGAYVGNAGAEYYMPNYPQCTKEIVDDIHSRGVKVFTWVVNGEFDCDRVMKNGVDAILTDDPEMVSRRRHFAEMEEEYPMGMAVCGWAD